MPSHAPRNAPIKQRETTAKRMARLRHAIASGAAPDAVGAAAENLRHSQLSILKARREILRYKPDSDEKSRELDSIGADEALWTGFTAEDIVSKYR